MEKGKLLKWVPLEELIERYTIALTEKLEKDLCGSEPISKVTMHPEDFLSHVCDFSESAYLTVSNGL